MSSAASTPSAANGTSPSRFRSFVAAIDRDVAVTFAVALLARVLWWALWTAVPENEGIQYMRRAENWLAGNGYVNLQGAPDVMATPLYPGLIAVTSLVFGSLELAGRFVSLVAGLSTVLLVRELAARAFGARVARVAGLAAALHPVLVALSVSIYGESLAMALTLAAAYFAARATETGSMWRVVGAGAAVGLGYLTRPEIIAFGGLVAAYLFLSRARSGRWLRGVQEVGVTAVVALALAAPYSIYLSGIAGSFRWEGKTGHNEVINERIRRGLPYMEAARGLDFDDDFERHAPYLGGPDLWADQSVFLRKSDKGRGTGDLLKAMPERVPDVAKLVASSARQWGSIVGVPFAAVLFVLGFVATRWWKRPSWLEAGLILSFLGLQSAVLLGVLFLWARYAYPLVPLVIPWVAYGGVWATDRVLRKSRPKMTESRRGAWVTGICIAGAAGVSLSSYRSVAWLDDFSQSTDVVVRDAGLWLREQPRAPGRARPLIMSSKSGVVHYAGGTLTYLPYTHDVSRALRYIHWKRPDFVVLRSQYLTTAPYLERWFEHGIPDECAVPLRRFESERSTVALFRWNCAK